MWRVEVPERPSVLLCGSVVGSSTRTETSSSNLEAMLAECRALWCEFPPTDEMASSPLLAAHGLSSDGLTTLIDDPLALRLVDACEHLGVDRASLEPMRPWLAAQIIDAAHATTCELDASSSIEAVLTRRASSLGVELRYEYPAADKAFGLFSGLNRDHERDYLSWTIDRSLHPAGTCATAARSWMQGSLAEITNETQEFRRCYPQLHDVLVVARNRAWVPRVVDAILGSGSPATVIVGAGHLVGTGSIPQLLDRHGLAVRRIDFSTET